MVSQCLKIIPKVIDSEIGRTIVSLRPSESEDVDPFDQFFGRENFSDDSEWLWLTSDSESVSSRFLDDLQLFDVWDFDCFDSRSNFSTSESFDDDPFDQLFLREEVSDDSDQCSWLTTSHDSDHDFQLFDILDFDCVDSDFLDSSSRFSTSESFDFLSVDDNPFDQFFCWEEFSDDSESLWPTSDSSFDSVDSDFLDSCSRFSTSESYDVISVDDVNDMISMSSDYSSFSTNSRTSSFRSVVDDSEWPQNQNHLRIQISVPLDLDGEESDWVSCEEFDVSYPDFASPSCHSTKNLKIQTSPFSDESCTSSVTVTDRESDSRKHTKPFCTKDFSIPLLDLDSDDSEWTHFDDSDSDFPSPSYRSATAHRLRFQSQDNRDINLTSLRIRLFNLDDEEDSDFDSDFRFQSSDSELNNQPLYWPFSDDSYSSLEIEKNLCSSPRKTTTAKNLSSNVWNQESKIACRYDGIHHRITNRPRRGVVQEQRRRRGCIKAAVTVKQSNKKCKFQK